MELELSSDQEFFVDTTRKFLDDKVPVSSLREHRHDAVGFPRKLWTQGAELGWTTLLVSEADGGGSVSGSPVADAALVAYEFGRHAAPGPLVPSNVVAAALSRSGSADQKAGPLAAILAGTAIGTWAHAEPRPNDRFGTVTSTLSEDGGVLRLTGDKAPVESAGIADYFLVTARSGDGLSQVLVPAGTPGVTVTAMNGVDVTKRYARVSFNNVELPSSAIVGTAGGAAGDIDYQTQAAIALELQEMVGCMSKAMEITVEWAADRYSFGRPLNSYQALKHRFADMKLWLEASHAIADSAAKAVDAGTGDAWDKLSAGKAYIGHNGTQLMHECVQLHGGIGVTYEHDVHLYLRRVVLNSKLNGSVAEHRQRLTASLEQKEAAQ